MDPAELAHKVKAKKGEVRDGKLRATQGDRKDRARAANTAAGCFTACAPAFTAEPRFLLTF